MSDFYMPDELFAKILTYLPPKLLVRFSCVCKSWQSLITNSNFITKHLNQTKLSNNINKTHLFLVRYLVHSTEERYSLYMDNNHTFDQYGLIELPFRRSRFSRYFGILATCNGLICLYDDYVESFRFHNAEHTVKNKKVILWNPSIRKSLTLPPPHYKFLADVTSFVNVLGFGFDLRTNDYKVVMITYLKSEKGQSRSVSVQLYKLSTGSWETITPAIDPWCSVCEYASQAFINGAVHWLASKSDDIGSLILSFNMSDEVFHEFSLPVSVAGNRDYRFGHKSVAVCGKRLLLFDYFEEFYYCNKSCSMSIWVMKEYGVVESWTKLYSIHLDGESIGLEKMLGFRRNGELLLAMRNKQLVSYNHRTRRVNYLGVCDSSDKWSCSLYVDAYVESLVLLGKAM